MSFVAGPTVVALIDDSVDMSIAFTANEEESSSKNLLSFEPLIEEVYSNHLSIQFLRTHSSQESYRPEGIHQVYLEVLSPPPRNI